MMDFPSSGKRKRQLEVETQEEHSWSLNHPSSSHPPPSSSSFTKRKREMTKEQQGHLESILQRVAHWLVKNEDIWPKTLQKLEMAIKEMCCSWVHISEEIIFYHLLFNGAIEMTTEEAGGGEVGEGGGGRVVVRGKKEIKPFEDFVGILLPSCYQTREEERERGGEEGGNGGVGVKRGGSVGFSDDFGYALQRSRDWVENNTGLHNFFVPKTSFLRSLKQLCTFKRGVPGGVVVGAMIKKGWVEVMGGGGMRIKYNPGALKAADGRWKYVVEERVNVGTVVERVGTGVGDAWGVEGAFGDGDGDGDGDVEMS